MSKLNSDDCLHIDIIKNMIADIDSSIQALKFGEAKQKQQLKKLKKVKKKLKFKKTGRSILHDVVELSINQIDAAISKSETDLEIMGLCKSMINDFEYNFDKRPDTVGFTSTNSFINYTGF